MQTKLAALSLLYEECELFPSISFFPPTKINTNRMCKTWRCNYPAWRLLSPSFFLKIEFDTCAQRAEDGPFARFSDTTPAALLHTYCGGHLFNARLVLIIAVERGKTRERKKENDWCKTLRNGGEQVLSRRDENELQMSQPKRRPAIDDVALLLAGWLAGTVIHIYIRCLVVSLVCEFHSIM